MDILRFLDILENTLNSIDVKGRDNLNRMVGCLMAIDKMREAMRKEETANGRQSDIGTDGGNDSNGG